MGSCPGQGRGVREVSTQGPDGGKVPAVQGEAPARINQQVLSQTRSLGKLPERPGTPLQLGTLGCCLSRPRGLISGDTLPPATSSRLLSSVSSPWSRGASARGGVPARLRSESWQGSGKEAFLPPAGERARKLPAFMSLAGPCAGCWLPAALEAARGPVLRPRK